MRSVHQRTHFFIMLLNTVNYTVIKSFLAELFRGEKNTHTLKLIMHIGKKLFGFLLSSFVYVIRNTVEQAGHQECFLN